MNEVRKTYEKRALTVKEVAEYACVGRTTVEGWLNRGLLPCEELPGRGGRYRFRRIRRADLERFLDESYRSNHQEKQRDSEKIILLPRGT